MFSISYFCFVYCLSVGSCIAVTELVLSYSSLIYLPHSFPNPCRSTMYSDRSWQFWVKYGEGEYIALLCWVQFGLQIWVTGYSRLWRLEQDSAAAKRPNMEAREDVEHSFCWPDGGFCHFFRCKFFLPVIKTFWQIFLLVVKEKPKRKVGPEMTILQRYFEALSDQVGFQMMLLPRYSGHSLSQEIFAMRVILL